MTRGRGDTGTRSALCPKPRVRGGKPQGSTVPHQNLRFDGSRLVGTSSPHHIGVSASPPLRVSASLLDIHTPIQQRLISFIPSITPSLHHSITLSLLHSFPPSLHHSYPAGVMVRVSIFQQTPQHPSIFFMYLHSLS